MVCNHSKTKSPLWLVRRVEQGGGLLVCWGQPVPDFIHSETPYYIGRAVVALAADPNIMVKTGHALSAGGLAREYDFTDMDGRQPPAYSPEGKFEGGYFMKVEQ